MSSAFLRPFIAVFIAGAGIHTPAFGATPLHEFHAPPCGEAAPASADAQEPTTADMTEPGEGIPHGVVNASGKPFGWAVGPSVHLGPSAPAGWQGINPTAMIYAPQDHPVSTGVRVQVRNLNLFVKLKTTGAWCLFEAKRSPNGALFAESFAGNRSIPATPRPEPTGGISVALVEGHNFHFFGDVKPLPPEGIIGVFAQYEARIIPDGGASDSDVAAARYVGAASADYWKSVNGPTGHVGTQNDDVAIGRFKKLSSAWRIFTMNAEGGHARVPH